MKATIRAMTAFDSAAVAALLPALGHEATAEQVRRRFSSIDGKPGHAFFVAVVEFGVVGWTHVYAQRVIDRDEHAEIGSLAVLAQHHRTGIGEQLVRRAEQWAEAHGFSRVLLRSSAHSEDARQFCEALGYSKWPVGDAFERCAPFN